MVQTISRLYDTYDQAIEAGRALKNLGLSSNQIRVLAHAGDRSSENFNQQSTEAATGSGADNVIAQIQQGGVSSADANFFAEGVRRGGTLLSVHVPEEQLTEAQSTMDRFQPTDPATRKADYAKEGWKVFDQAAPFSAFFHLPVLLRDE